MKKLSIIIPCYNEEGNIEECVMQIPKIKWETEIIIVDDGSKDRTTEVARRIKVPNKKVIRYEKNGGKGYAFRTGYKHATGDVVIILDADYTSPPAEIPNVVKPIFEGKADFVNGTRFIYPMEKGAMRWIHKPGNKIFAFIVSMLIGKWLTDSLCGFKAFDVKKLPYNHLKENSWMDFELLLRAHKNRLRIVEVPIHYKARKAGESKMNTLKHGYNMGMSLVKSFIKSIF